MQSSLLRRVLLFAVVSGGLLGGTSSFALPQFMIRFSQDPFSRAEFRDQCSTCHISPKGGGARNAFGAAFEKNKKVITPEFRAAWPDHFVPSVSTPAAAAPGGEVKATFLANGQETILEIDGQFYRLIADQAKLEKIESQQAAQLEAAPPPPPAAAPEEAKLPLKDQPTFDHYLVNLPTTLPYRPGTLSMRFTHRFSQGVLNCDQNCAGIGNLYGLDSFSDSSFGAEYGITSRIAGSIYRSPLNTTIEMGGIFQLLRQTGAEPISLSFRASIEGRQNFQDFFTENLVMPISRSISNVAEVFVDPMISFNANPLAPFTFPDDPIGVKRRNQGAVGLGASIRFRPRTAFVMEWTPRVGGYHAADSHNAYSFGLQRTTNGHVFELTLSNTIATTTSQAVSGGQSALALGFNVYRRLYGRQ